MRRFALAMVVISVLGAGVTRYEAGSRVREVGRAGRFLTDRVRIEPATRGAPRELKFAERSLWLSDRQTAGFAGDSVFVITAEEGGSRVQLFAPDGTRRFTLDVRDGLEPIPFGPAIAIIGRAEHEPDLDYDLEIAHEGGSNRLIAPKRRILDLTPVDGLLALASIDLEERTARTELVDRNGRVIHVFDSADAHRPRPAVAAERFAAVTPGPGVSTLALAIDGGPDRLIELPYGLTDLAFIDDGTGLLLWGARDRVLVDLPSGRVRWAGSIASGRQLSSPGSAIARVGGVLTMALREELADGRWRVTALPIDAETGSSGEPQFLFEGPRLPTQVARFRRGATERLVFPGRVFVVAEEP